MLQIVPIEVPGLGTFRGIESNGVRQWKNVPFGSYSKRFEPATLARNVGERDCTRPGPMCPQQPPYSDSYLGATEPRPIEYNVSEFDCLNLMITAPTPQNGPSSHSGPGTPGELGPVVVWIHGGSNCMGTAYRGIYDPSEWVKRTGIVVVTLQFRIGLFGFLPFEGRGNFGLMDQHLGIEWVSQYIKHFGGDAERISVFGQSSGSGCAYIQTCRSDRKFRRAAYLSGSIHALRCRSLDEYSNLSTQLCTILGCRETDLRTVSWETLVDAFSKTGVNVLSACDDGHFLPKGTYYDPPSPPLEAALVSDCSQDGWFFKDGLEPGVLASMVPGVDDDLEACRLLTDYIFFAGNYTTSRALERQGTRIYHQLFDAVNPLTPELGNNHMVELFFGLMAYPLGAEAQGLAATVQDAWARFARFEEPWPEAAHIATTISLLNFTDLGKVRDLEILKKQLDVTTLVTGW